MLNTKENHNYKCKVNPIPGCIVIGDLNLDIIMPIPKGFPELGKEILSSNYRLVIGGSGGIFSSILSMLGISTGIISKVGNNYFGNFLLDSLKKIGADIGDMIICEYGITRLTLNLSCKKDKNQISSNDLIKSLRFSEISFKNRQSLKHIHISSYYMMKGLKKDYPGWEG